MEINNKRIININNIKYKFNKIIILFINIFYNNNNNKIYWNNM